MRAHRRRAQVEDVDGEQILHHEYIQIKASHVSEHQKQRRVVADDQTCLFVCWSFAQANEDIALTFTVPLFDPLPPQYFVRAAADHWLVPDAVLAMSFRCDERARAHAVGLRLDARLFRHVAQLVTCAMILKAVAQ